jgi:hypothetical protein
VNSTTKLFLFSWLNFNSPIINTIKVIKYIFMNSLNCISSSPVIIALYVVMFHSSWSMTISCVWWRNNQKIYFCLFRTLNSLTRLNLFHTPTFHVVTSQNTLDIVHFNQLIWTKIRHNLEVFSNFLWLLKVSLLSKWESIRCCFFFIWYLYANQLDLLFFHNFQSR